MERRVLIANFSIVPAICSGHARAFFLVRRTPPTPTDPRRRRLLRMRQPRPPPHRPRLPSCRTTPTSGATSLVEGETVERDVRDRNTPNIVAVFTNRGARLKSWRLKHYRDSQGESLELVANDVAGQPLPFSLTLPDAATTASLNGGLYAAREEARPAQLPSSQRRLRSRLNIGTAAADLDQAFHARPRRLHADLRSGDHAKRSPACADHRLGPGPWRQ